MQSRNESMKRCSVFARIQIDQLSYYRQNSIYWEVGFKSDINGDQGLRLVHKSFQILMC